jgi:hypothetical protein
VVTECIEGIAFPLSAVVQLTNSSSEPVHDCGNLPGRRGRMSTVGIEEGYGGVHCGAFCLVRSAGGLSLVCRVST